MSFDSMFNMNSYMPQSKPKKKNGNGIESKKVFDQKCFGDECFNPSEFFGGFSSPKNNTGIQKVEGDLDRGLVIPELGAEYNTRFGRIGTGFTEAVDPYQIGFKDILTGNGRTGEIIGRSGGFVSRVKRGRGRPRKAKGIGKLSRVKGKNLEIETSEVRKRRKAGEDVKTESRSVGSLLKEGVKSKLSREGSFKKESVDLGSGQGRLISRTTEGKGVYFTPSAEEGGVTFATGQ